MSERPKERWDFRVASGTAVLVRRAAEVTREKLFLRIHDEIPYNATVETEKFTIQKDGSYRIDQVVYVTGKKLRPGDFVNCELVAAKGYDLIGVAIGKPRR